jgi:hypothetical protein
MKLLVAIVVVSLAGMHAPQRTPGAPAEKTVPLTIALKAGGKVYNFTGQGKCTYAPIASIYAMRAEQWRAERVGDGPSATMTVWRPAVGSDMVTLAFTIGDTRYSMNTVKVGGKGTPEGSGTVTIAREGAAGTFTITGTAGNGTSVSGTVKCGGFTKPNAEGGELSPS